MKKVLLGIAILLGLFTVVFVVSFGIFLWNYDETHPNVTQALTEEQQRNLNTTPYAIAQRRKQYIEQYRQLWRVDDYATVRKKAQDGNPIAQRRLYEIFDYCMEFPRSDTVAMLKRISSVNATVSAAISELDGQYARHCSATTGGAEASGKARAFWMRQSAKRGDLVSQMRVRAAEAKDAIPPKEFDALIERAVASGDPASIMEIGTLLPLLKRPWPDASLAPAFESPMAIFAWNLAACRAGMDCERGSRLMTQVCMRGMSCSWPNYEAYVATEVVPREKLDELERLIAIIEQVVLNPKRFAS